MPELASLKVSRQGFGAMGLSSVYGHAEDEASVCTIHRAIDLGICFFDTATGYPAEQLKLAPPAPVRRPAAA